MVSALGPISIGRIVWCKDRVGLCINNRVRYAKVLEKKKIRYTTVGVGRRFYVHMYI